MNDPQRLLDAPLDPIVRDLLSSANRDDPSPDAMNRTASALGIAGLVSATAAGTATLSSAAQAATTQASTAQTAAGSGGVAAAGLGAKWLILGGVTALGVAGALLAIASGPDPVEAPIRSTIAAPIDRDAAKVEPNASAGDPGVAQAPVPAAATAAAAPPAPATHANNRASKSVARPTRRPTAREVASKLPLEAPAKSIAEEIAILDRARRQLAAGDGRGALRSLDELGPGGSSALGPEVSVLRIRALAQTGQAQAAAQNARDFLNTHPGSPHARELQNIATQAPGAR